MNPIVILSLLMGWLNIYCVSLVMLENSYKNSLIKPWNRHVGLIWTYIFDWYFPRHVLTTRHQKRFMAQ